MLRNNRGLLSGFPTCCHLKESLSYATLINGFGQQMHRLLILLLAFSSCSLASVIERPTHVFEQLDESRYGWLPHYDEHLFNTYINDNAARFISENELQRYVKLRFRNFVKDLKLKDNIEHQNHNYMDVSIDLYKYNDTLKIHYGMMSIKIAPSINWDSNNTVPYVLAVAIAGSEEQLNQSIKEHLGSLIEVIAEDYYYISDLTMNND
nr:hypothetical protein BCU13_13740 [Vibrio lentus]